MASGARDLQHTPIRRRQALFADHLRRRCDDLSACQAPRPRAAHRHRPNPGRQTPIAVATRAPVAAATTVVTAQPKTGGTLRFGTAADIANLGFGSISFEILQGMYDPAPDVRRQAPTRAAPRRKLGAEQRLQADQAQSAQGRQVPQRPRIHQRRRQVQPAARGDPTKSSPSQLVGLAKCVDRRDARQVHRRYEVRSAAHRRVRPPRPSCGSATRRLLEGPDAKTEPIGTGPFTFVEWVQGDHVQFREEHELLASGRPYLDGYVVQFTKDPQALVVRLEAGALDFVTTRRPATPSG